MIIYDIWGIIPKVSGHNGEWQFSGTGVKEPWKLSRGGRVVAKVSPNITVWSRAAGGHQGQERTAPGWGSGTSLDVEVD